MGMSSEALVGDQMSNQLSLDRVIARLEEQGIEYVRIAYSDMHGYARGKDIPLDYFKDVVEDGTTFCIANIVDGLASNPLNAPGMAPDLGYPDMRAVPDLSTLVPIPWEQNTMQCLADLVDSKRKQVEIAPRQFLKKVLALYATKLQLKPILAHELEFYVLQKAENGWQRYSNHTSMVYTVGKQADEQGILRDILAAGKAMGLKLTAANHEFGGGQFEVNMLHGEGLEAADRAFRFKNMVKELAACRGFLATFMGKPFNGDTGSGYHIHLSLTDLLDNNVFYDALTEDGLSELAKHFIAGILHHAPALAAFLLPTVNAYKRLVPDSLVPTAAHWGYDNRTTFIRVPVERKSATRLEIRAGDAAANPYLISAVCLLAGYAGIMNKLEPPSPVSGDISIRHDVGLKLPENLGESIQALLNNTELCELIGQPLVKAFSTMKSVEHDRYKKYVTDWEFNEYAFHL